MLYEQVCQIVDQQVESAEEGSELIEFARQQPWVYANITREDLLLAVLRRGVRSQTEEREAVAARPQVWGGGRLLSTLRQLPSPSEIGKTHMRREYSGIWNAYYPSKPAQPAALVHPAFATLLEGLDGAEVDQDTSRLCTQLYAVMARSYSRPRPVTRKQQAQEARNISDEEIVAAFPPEENGDTGGEEKRMVLFRRVMTPYVRTRHGLYISSDQEDGSFPNGMAIFLHKNLAYPCLSMEGKEYWGSAGTSDPYFQNIGNYLELVKALPMDNSIVCNTVMPCIGLEVLGAYLRVSALWLTDKVCCEPLGPMVPMMPTASGQPDRSRLGRLLSCMCSAVEEIQDFYEQASNKAGAVASADFHGPNGAARLPFQLRTFRDVQALGRRQQQRVFLVQHEGLGTQVAKFVYHPYNEELHQQWADRGLAPCLTGLPDSVPRSRAGPFQLIWQEHLSSEDGWQHLHEVDPFPQELEQALTNALTELHRPIQLQGSLVDCVHGDIREPNILIRKGPENWEVRFLDLDWAGQADVKKYPHPMNHTDIDWPTGAAEGLPMQQSHDRSMLTSCISRCRRRSPPSAQVSQASLRCRAAYQHLPRLRAPTRNASRPLPGINRRCLSAVWR